MRPFVRSLALLIGIVAGFTATAQDVLFNDDWQFAKNVETPVDAASFIHKDKGWQKVSLPHTAQLEPLVITGTPWQGICVYRKFFTLSRLDAGKHIALQFEGAMHEAHVYLNGELLQKHYGGYLPFYVDISSKIKWGEENCVVVWLSNKDDKNIPPGKPTADLDFVYYSGIYRNVHLIKKNKLHFTDAVAANREAGGGFLTHYENVSNTNATIHIKAEPGNETEETISAYIKLKLYDGRKLIAEQKTAAQEIPAKSFGSFACQFNVKEPQLWSPEQPHLYTVSAELISGKETVDAEKFNIGIKSFSFDSTGFILNGQPYKIRGTNRHQEYPFIGNALSDNANYRDAYKIKEAGFNFVRLSHYPHSNSFLNACDELGLLVMDATPGWQFFSNNDTFLQRSYQDIRDMIRRDRNHASIILWEASLNESRMSKEYMQTSHSIVHKELPFKDVYTIGWLDGTYDLFSPARAHAKDKENYWRNYKKTRPLFIAEYGDWEYYAQNAGFNQKEFKDLKKEERSTRQLRGAGEKRLLQMALNYQESFNDNLKGNYAGDAIWVMYDYNRGYAPDIESSGIMDIYRLPKFAYYFYQSQPDAKVLYPPLSALARLNEEPVIRIASYWSPVSSKDVKVFSNCEEVALSLNGQLIARQKPDKDSFSTHLAHPPFTFKLPAYQPGKLEAVGYYGGLPMITHQVTTAGEPYAIKLSIDESGKPLQANCNDIAFVYATVVDKNGNPVFEGADNLKIAFAASGDVLLIGNATAPVEAGIATVLVKAGRSKEAITIKATAPGLQAANLTVILK